MPRIDASGFVISKPSASGGRDVLVVHQRFAKPRDLPDILDIDSGSFEHPWDKETFVDHFQTKGRNCTGRVAEYRSRIVGYMIYRTGRSSIELVRFAVHPDAEFARRGIGTQMFNDLTTLLSSKVRTITLYVRESNLAAQLFYRRMGLKATAVVRGHYKDSGEDAYRMAYSL